MNYNKLMEEEINNIVAEGKTPSVLLHSCCAPCSSHVIDTLTKYFDITILAKKPEEVANNIFDSIDILDTISDNIQLPSVVRYNNNSYKVNWESSDPSQS